MNRCFSVRACSGSLIRQLSYAMVDSRLLIQPINDSRFYSTAEVSFLTTESHNNCQSKSPLNSVWEHNVEFTQIYHHIYIYTSGYICIYANCGCACRSVFDRTKPGGLGFLNGILNYDWPLVKWSLKHHPMKIGVWVPSQQNHFWCYFSPIGSWGLLSRAVSSLQLAQSHIFDSKRGHFVALRANVHRICGTSLFCFFATFRTEQRISKENEFLNSLYFTFRLEIKSKSSTDTSFLSGLSCEKWFFSIFLNLTRSSSSTAFSQVFPPTANFTLPAKSAGRHRPNYRVHQPSRYSYIVSSYCPVDLFHFLVRNSSNFIDGCERNRRCQLS